MNKEQTMVKKFHRKFGFTINEIPTKIPVELGKIRHKHTLKEMGELEIAIHSQNLIKIADALGDLLYFVYGTAVAYGIDMEPVFLEIHRSNMTKERPFGGGDAKAAKGDNYTPPDLTSLLKEQSK